MTRQSASDPALLVALSVSIVVVFAAGVGLGLVLGGALR